MAAHLPNMAQPNSNLGDGTQADAVLINHGEFHIGSAAAPFAHNATISLHGGHQSLQLPVFGIKVVGMTRGKMMMYGLPKTPWLKLGAPAEIGSHTLTLDFAPTNWYATPPTCQPWQPTCQLWQAQP